MVMVQHRTNAQTTDSQVTGTRSAGRNAVRLHSRLALCLLAVFYGYLHDGAIHAMAAHQT
jgi:hypothetical protein